MQINSAGHAIHGDFFSISGSQFSDDIEVVFSQGGTVHRISPEFVRPHLVLVGNLPTAVTTGNYQLTVENSSGASNAIPIGVSAGTLLDKRIIHSGAAKERPYTIAFVANPAIETVGGQFISDPILTQRNLFHSVVVHCYHNLFLVTEDLLRVSEIDRDFRTFTIFDNSLTASDENALAHEIAPNMMETRRAKLVDFLNRYEFEADFVFVLHGSTSHDRATAWFTSDDPTSGSTAFTYDGVSRQHGHFAAIPGSAAIPLNVDRSGLTVIHEFGHGASDFNNGRIQDLYHDGSPVGFSINKKMRSTSGDPIPSTFATYNGESFDSDQNRDGLGYQGGWRSYHPELADATRPNLMDNYWQTAEPQRCRFDQLSSAWFRDRLNAKLGR